MTGITRSWEIVGLEDACEIIRGITFPTTAKQFHPGAGLIACLRTANVQTVVDWNDLWFVPQQYVSSDRQFVAIDDILISTANSYELVGKVSRVTYTKYASTLGAFISLLRAREGVDAAFLYYQMSSEKVQRSIRAMSSTTTNISNVSGEKLKTLQLNLPPRAEQTRIVAKLEELLSDLDAGVAELKAAQKKLVQYRQSLLKAAVEGTLTAEWRAQQQRANDAQSHTPGTAHPSAPAETGAQLLARILTQRRARWEEKQLARFAEKGQTPPKDWRKKYPEPVKPDTTDLPALPEGWVWASVDQLTVEQKYGSSSKTNEDAAGIPVLRMGNIQDGELDFSNLKYLPRDHSEFPGLYLHDGDLLFNRTNSPELVGKTTVYRSQIEPCSFASYLIGVRFSSGYLPEIASAFINSVYGKYWIKSVVVQQVGQANVNGSKLSALAVPVPTFLEQREIVSELDFHTSEITDQLKRIDISLKQSTAQRQNILRAAFAGQLVPQDPNDEPASVLLERIRAERAAQLPVKKTRGRKAKESA